MDLSPFSRYQTSRTLRFPYWDGTKPRLPIQAVAVNGGGQVTESYTVDSDQTAQSGGVPTGLAAGTNQGHYRAWTRYSYDTVTGHTTSVKRYHKIPSSGDGTLDTNFYETLYEYAALGDIMTTEQYVRTDAGQNKYQLTERVYDKLGRLIEIKKGFTAASPRRVQRIEYDGGGPGDGWVTRVVQYYSPGPDSNTANTGANYYRTYRGHLRGIEPIFNYNQTAIPPTYSVQGPFTVHDVNWRGQTMATAHYSSN